MNTPRYIVNWSWMFFVAMLVVFASCNREDAPDCLQSAGTYAIEERSLESFSVIELNDYIQYELCDTNYFGVLITAPGNLIADIETEVEAGRLIIRNRNKCNFVRSYKNRITIRICAPDFKDIQNYATGDIITVNAIEGYRFSMDNRSAAGVHRLFLNVDTVNIATHTGVSDAIVSGQCDVVYLFNQGVGKMDARQLQSQSAYVNNSSLNNVYVNVQDYLYAYILFSGSVFYDGNPASIDQTVDGSGSLRPL
jgi:hypothetical protein